MKWIRKPSGVLREPFRTIFHIVTMPIWIGMYIEYKIWAWQDRKKDGKKN